MSRPSAGDYSSRRLALPALSRFAEGMSSLTHYQLERGTGIVRSRPPLSFQPQGSSKEIKEVRRQKGEKSLPNGQPTPLPPAAGRSPAEGGTIPGQSF